MGNFKSYQCPFCRENFPLIKFYTYLEKCTIFHPGNVEGAREGIFGAYGNPLIEGMKEEAVTETIWLYFYHCPNAIRQHYQ